MTELRKNFITDETSGVTANVKTNSNTTENELLVNSPGHVCSENSTTDNLIADASWTGTDWQDTLDYGVISVSIITDQNSATNGLEAQWSNDGINIVTGQTDYFTILANHGKTFTFGPADRYIRLKYTNGSGGTTTVFDIITILRRCYVKPSSHRITDNIVGEDDAELTKSVLTGLSPNDEFINIEAAYNGSLKTAIQDGETGSRAEVEPLGALKVESPVRLVGTTFSNGTKDPNFWAETVTGSGSVTQAGKITLSTGTTADSTAKYATVRKARKITGTTNQFRCVAGLTTDAQVNNIRRMGAYDENDGFFFQANGTTMQIASRRSASDTTVSSGSFSGNYGSTWVPVAEELYRLVIDYTAVSAKFFVNGTLLHTILNTTTGFTNTLTLPVTMENINSGGNTTDNSFVVSFATILRLGELITNGKYAYLGDNDTTVLKYGAGTLQRIVNLDNAGIVTVYDNTAGSGDKIAVIDTAKALGTLEFNAPFSNGLTVVVATGAKITVIYE